MASFSRVVVVALAVVVALVVVAPAALVSATCTTSADCSDAAPYCGSSFGGPLECLTCQESAASPNDRHNFCNSRSAQTPFCNVNGACAPCTSVTSASACQATYGQPDCLPDGTCGCAPKCTGKVCGADGCGGVCGTCTGAQEVCSTDQTQCQCVPECTGKVCGDDGCGGSCGSCTGAQEQCNTAQTACECVPDCTGGNVCGADGCGGVCGTCTNGGSCNAGDTCDCVNGWVGDLCDGIPTGTGAVKRLFPCLCSTFVAC